VIKVVSFSKAIKKIVIAMIIFLMVLGVMPTYANYPSSVYTPAMQSSSYFMLANQGRITFAGVDWMTLSFGRGQTLSVVVDHAPRTIPLAGVIQGPGGRVYLTHQGVQEVFRNLVNQTGVVEALSGVNRNGIVELVPSQFENQRTLSWYLESEGF
jgi:hypothetical protein